MIPNELEKELCKELCKFGLFTSEYKLFTSISLYILIDILIDLILFLILFSLIVNTRYHDLSFDSTFFILLFTFTSSN